jgi:hypothetical protein
VLKLPIKIGAKAQKYPALSLVLDGKITAIFVAYSSFNVGYTTVWRFHGKSLQSFGYSVKFFIFTYIL